jgi:hypothetical protein
MKPSKSSMSLRKRARRLGLLGLLGLGLALSVGEAIAPRGALAADPAPTRPAGLTLDALLTRFRGIVGLSASFHEEKRIALLAQPLVSEGTVHYAPPGRIARQTLTPEVSGVVLDGTTLRFGDAKSSHSVDTSASPVIRAFVDSFLAVLAGDRGALERSFVVDFKNPSGQKWELGLSPRDANLAHILVDIHFVGDGLELSEMRIREATGDVGRTTFSNVDTAHVYSQEEAARVFRLPGA